MDNLDKILLPRKKFKRMKTRSTTCGHCKKGDIIAECSRCVKDLCEACVHECWNCEKKRCLDCAEDERARIPKCGECSEEHCVDCVQICNSGDHYLIGTHYVCESCSRESCNTCGGESCYSCMVRCDDCKKDVCLKCRTYCKHCNRMYCDHCGTTCVACKVFYCVDAMELIRGTDDYKCDKCAGVLFKTK